MTVYDFIDIFDDLKTERLETILEQIKEYVKNLADNYDEFSELRDNYIELLDEATETGRYVFDDFIPYLTELSDLEADDMFGTEGMRLG